MFSAIRFMDSVTFWGVAPAVKAKDQQQVESLQTRVAYREALVSLRSAQRHLDRREGGYGADMNPVLAGEIRAAIREIHSVGTWEFEQEPESLGEAGCESKYGAALACLAKAEAALADALAGELPGVRGLAKSGGTLKQTLLHVRTAKWWVAPKAAPRYTQVLVAR